MMGEPAAHLTVNGTSATATDMSRAAPDDTRALPQQFWAGFWAERLRALKRHIESAQASTSGPAPNVGPAAEVSRGVPINQPGSAIRAGRRR